MHMTCGTRIHGEEIPKPLTLIDSLCHVIIHEGMIHAMLVVCMYVMHTLEYSSTTTRVCIVCILSTYYLVCIATS